MRINGTLPILVAELRLKRRQQRARLGIWCAAGVATLAVMLLPRPELYVLQWTLLAAFAGIMVAGRPCVGCGRWGRHTLTCPRGRP